MDFGTLELARGCMAWSQSEECGAKMKLQSTTMYIVWLGGEGNYRAQVHLSFIQHKSLEIVCTLEIKNLENFDTRIKSKNPTLRLRHVEPIQ
jgi:hypothetical protein